MFSVSLTACCMHNHGSCLDIPNDVPSRFNSHAISNKTTPVRICTNLTGALFNVRTTQNFVCFAKKSVNAKPFLVRTTFCTHQNFCKRNETLKIPSTSFGGCKNFVRRENPLFLDILPSLGHQILQHGL